ncbi:2-hydroxy-6-oxohepta-2,4-dienoate hydrolase [Helicobacter sp. 13S00401-1]|uniref:alpha/beta fold hydrolase n=1 Tax=Helicobacter sp. 13S00401-1 TaxID=1905758 RepID=UPI000BA715FA|nr:alpha/beta hydrolase [Helicobacter sp. 13S00401-1]PAF51883.1 2-hydroxy-6-oxohepta-2,4-dienoate hydrolase [Helicobacter sp. 13S00401-1]
MASKQITCLDHTFNISYLIIDNKADKNLCFLHGWGSNKELMKLAFENSFKDYNHIYVDLPGFGASSNPMVLDSKKYALILKGFFEKLSINNVQDINLLAGHSFGGKLALLFDYEILLLSSAGILLEKSFKTKSKIAISKLFKSLGIKASFLRSKDADNLPPNMYETFKLVVNEDFSPYYANFKKNASVFWGESDTATPLKSFEIIKSLMSNARFFMLKGDHYFFLKQANTIEKLYKNL